MHKTKFLFVPALFLAILCFTLTASAQTPPASQTAGGVVRQEAQRLRQQRLEEKIEKDRARTETVGEEDLVLPGEGAKTMVKTIKVEDATLLKADEIRAITSKYEGKELTIEGMQMVADLITDEYRKKGYVTSRAYIPPQTIADGVLVIKVVEGKLGSLDIKGNKYFKTDLLKKKIGLEEQGVFDYSALQKSLVYINEHPDRIAKAILVPGKAPGTTDVVLEVTDNYPFHAEFIYDNYASRYLNQNRYSIELEHNNITGHDDKLFAKGQLSDGDYLVLQQGRYSYPISRRWEVGTYALLSKTKLKEEFEDLQARGDAKIFGLYSNYLWIDHDDLAVGLNLGFDYKKIQNDLNGAQLSRDELSIAKAGTDIDYIDSWGRTILTAEIDQGIPEFLGAMDRKDADASRAGAGGKFTKWAFNLFRLQPMFWESHVLLKNSFQYTTNTLPASEQFQIGGPTSVRGYPSGEFSGDNGFYSAFEWSFPPYGLSKEIKFPLREERLYDVFRIVLFYDIGLVHNNVTLAGETETQTLRSAGFGGRFTMAEDFELRVETGYPLGGPSPSDGDNHQTWVEVHVKF